MKKVLICGSRKYGEIPDTSPDPDEQARLTVLAYAQIIGELTVISGLIRTCEEDGERLLLIDGGAQGADRWAREVDHPMVDHETRKADWTKHGKAAGVIRNREMLEEFDPHIVWAFRLRGVEARGTEDMIRRARKADIPTFETTFHAPGGDL